MALEGALSPEPIRRPAEDTGEDTPLLVECEARAAVRGGNGEVPEDRAGWGYAPEAAEGAHPHAPRSILEECDRGGVRSALRVLGTVAVAGEAARLEVEHQEARRLAGSYPQPVAAVHDPPVPLFHNAIGERAARGALVVRRPVLGAEHEGEAVAVGVVAEKSLRGEDPRPPALVHVESVVEVGH